MFPLMTPALMFAVDRKGCFTLFETRPARRSKQVIAVGASLDSIAGSHPALAAAIRRALGGESFTELTPVGRQVYEISYAPTRSASRRVNGVMGVAPNAPASDPAREDPDTMLRALYRATTDVILHLNSSGLYLNVAPTNPSLLYRPADQLIGKTLHEVFAQPEADTFLKAIRKAIKTRQTVHLEHSLPIGNEQLWFSASISPMSGKEVVWFARDITQQRLQERALRDSEERYRRLFDNIGDICFVLDRDWRYLHINQAASRIMKPRNDSIIGRSVVNVMRSGHEEAHYATFLQVMERQKPRSFISTRLLLPGCLPGTFEVFLHPVTEGIMCIAHNITERMAAEEALKRSEERYHALFVESGEPLFMTTLDGAILDFNQAALDLFGYTRTEVLDVKAHQLYDNPQDRKQFTDALETRGSIRDFAVRMRRKDGSRMDCLITAATRRTPDGRLEGYQGVIRDITAQKVASDALRESEARFRAVFEGTNFGIAVLDLSGRPLLVNPALEGMFAYTADELRGLSLRSLFHPDSADAQWRLFRSLARNERDHYQTEARCVTAADQTLWAHLTMSVVWDANDRPLYIIGLIEDISERKRAEDSLRDSEERYRLLVEFAPEPIVVHAEGVLIYANKACADLLGAENPDDLLGKQMIDFVHPDFKKIVEVRMHDTQVERNPVPLLREKYVRLDGRAIDVEVVAIPIIYHGRTAGQVLIHDITEQVRAQENERALVDALLRSATVVNSTLELDEVLASILTSLGQVVPHDSATIMLVEDGSARVVGHHGWSERGAGPLFETLRFKISEIGNLRTMAETGQPLLIGDLRHYQGWVDTEHTEWVQSYAGVPIVLAGETIGFINLESAEPHFFTPEQTQRLLTFAEHAALAIRNARLYADLQRHATELEERNKDLDAFSQTVAHDLKAPLHIILGYSSLLLSDFTSEFDEETLGYLQNIEGYAHKLDEMIESLLLLAKLRDAETRAMPTDIKALATSALGRYTNQITERGIAVTVAPDLPPAIAYSPWVEEVFANLLENAIKYLGANNNAPRIDIRGRRIDGGRIRYEVQDNGIGIAREHHPDLFKMFTRVHPGHAKGAGLGLSIVERIITKLGGQVGVESEEGQGSTFWFTLPTG